MTIEGICNQALDLIGEKRHIGSIYDGSTVARIALNAWGQTRDDLLQQLNPLWAMKDATLTLHKSAPVGGDYAGAAWNSTNNPELPWLFEYEYPDDCVQPRQIKPQLIFVPEYRPRAIPFRLSLGTGKTILCNEPNAILAYTAQVLDPDIWQSDFTMRMIAMLATKFKAELSDMKADAKEPANANATR